MVPGMVLALGLVMVRGTVLGLGLGMALDMELVAMVGEVEVAIVGEVEVAIVGEVEVAVVGEVEVAIVGEVEVATVGWQMGLQEQHKIMAVPLAGTVVAAMSAMAAAAGVHTEQSSIAGREEEGSTDCLLAGGRRTLERILCGAAVVCLCALVQCEARVLPSQHVK